MEGINSSSRTGEYFEDSKPVIKVEAEELFEIKTERESPLKKAIKLEPAKKEVDFNSSSSTGTGEYFENSKPVIKVEAEELIEIKTENESPLKKAIKLEPALTTPRGSGFLLEVNVCSYNSVISHLVSREMFGDLRQ